MQLAIPHLPERRCHAVSAVVRAATLFALMSSGCSSNPPIGDSAANQGDDGNATAGAIVGGAAGAAVGAVGGATLGALGAFGLCAPLGPFAIFCAPVGAVVGGVGGAIELGKKGAEWGAEAATASPRGMADAREPAVAAPASETVDTGTDSFELARSAAQIGRGADRPVPAEVLEPPGASETPVSTAGLAKEPGVAAPAPVALAAPSDAATHSPSPPVTGLPATGTTWTYEVADRMYGRNTTSFTVEVIRTHGRVVEEHLSAISRATSTRTMQRAIDADSAAFVEYPIRPDAVLLEFAPYLLAARGEDASAEEIDGAGYPVGSGNPIWVTRTEHPVWEQVTGPAGTFRALRLEISGRRIRSPFSSIVTYRFRIRVWYAPEVQRYVRLEREEWLAFKQASHIVVELEKYSPPS
jgi:hypothetical protein